MQELTQILKDATAAITREYFDGGYDSWEDRRRDETSLAELPQLKVFLTCFDPLSKSDCR